MYKETNESRSTLSEIASRTDGRESLSLQKLKENYPGARNPEEARKIDASLRSISQPGRYQASVLEAFEGTNVRAALRMNPATTKAAILSLLIDASDFVDAKKRLDSPEDYAFTADTLLEKFPSFTLEDFKLCTDAVKAGTHFERLKAGEFVREFEKYDEKKSEAAALRAQYVQRVEAEDRQRLVMRVVSEVAEIEGSKEQNIADWISGKKSNLTKEQRAELQERDRARRDA